MNQYENVIILKPNLSERKLTEIFSKVEAKIEEFATIKNKQDLGKRKLAYEIANNKEGHYFLYQFTLNKNEKKDVIKNIEFLYRITDEIIKYLIVSQ